MMRMTSCFTFNYRSPASIFRNLYSLPKLLRVESVSLYVKERERNLSDNKEYSLWSGKRITIIGTSEEGLPM